MGSCNLSWYRWQKKQQNDASPLVSILFTQYVPTYKLLDLRDMLVLDCVIFSMNDMLSFFKVSDHKQPSSDVLIKRYSENMQQIYRRKPMLKRDFNIVALQLYWNCTSAWVFSGKFAAYLENSFSYEGIWSATSDHFWKSHFRMGVLL